MNMTHDQLAGLSPDDKRALLARLLRERSQQPRQVPLTFAQEQFWFFDQLNPASPLYNLPRALRLIGPLDLPPLERAYAEIVRRHDALRATFPVVDGQPAQVVAPSREVTVPVVDLSDAPAIEREARVAERVAEEARRPFDLARGPLLRALLLRLDAEEHVLITTVHHIAFDGWSMGILDRELIALCAAFAEGRPSPLPDLPIRYADYAVWQRGRSGDKQLLESLAYWRTRLANAPTALELPTDRPRPPVQTFAGATYARALPEGLTAALKELGRAEGATLFMVLLAAFQVLLRRYTGQDDFLVGSPVAGRTRVETEGLIGLFAGMLVLRGDLSGDPTVRELLARVRATALDAYAHQDVPFEQLVEEFRPARDPGRGPLIQVMFGLLNFPHPTIPPGDLTPRPMDVDTATSKLDLTLTMIEARGGLRVKFEYNTDIFDAPTIERLAGHYQILLEGVVADPDRHVSALPLLTEPERHRLLVEWNDTNADYPRDRCIHDLFEEQAARTPEAVAVVVYDDTSLTYRALDERANRLAHHLRGLGVGPETLVGLCVERSPAMVVGLLGILKAGGAYVPLDPAYPAERLTFMLRDTRAPVLLTQQRLRDQFPAYDGAVVLLDEDWPAIGPDAPSAPRAGVRVGNLAYVMYTSGSTGPPKGVMITHRAVCNRLHWGITAYGFTARDRFLHKASLGFDASVWELFSPLLIGARLILARPHAQADGAYLADLIARHGITVVHFVPSLLRAFLQEKSFDTAGSLRHVICGGDILPRELQERFFAHSSAQVQLHNQYGPTESCISASLWTCRRGSTDATIPIGRPIANMRIYLLDRDLQPVPIGVPGELHIGGAGLARGYLDRPDLTAERFIPHPFSDKPGARLYKTGDLARYRPDGAIEFLGRLDGQVKIRGVRVEPGEVEGALRAHPAVREAAVVARADMAGDARLVAYAVREPAHDRVEGDDLRRAMARRLPRVLVPAAVVFLDALPRGATGKVDYSALPDPGAARPAHGAAFVPPRTSLQRRVTEMWEELLDVRPIGITDDFFDLGGHSLLAVRLVYRIEQEYERKLPLALLFEEGTVERVSRELEQQTPDEPLFPLAPIQPRGARPPFFYISPIEGGIVGFRALARLLGDDQPVYGIEAYPDQLRRLPDRSVEEAAAHLVRSMRERQPAGPYFLAGYSFSGVLAFEAARQLRAAGQDVPLLVLFDTLCPVAARPVRQGAAALLVARGAHRVRVARGQLGFHAAAARALPPRERRAYVVRRARALGRRLMGGRRRARQPGGAQGLPAPFAPLFDPYVPEAYPGRITYFWAARNPLGAWGAADPRRGWRRLATGGLELHRIQTDHIGIWAEHLQTVARHLRSCLIRAQQ